MILSPDHNLDVKFEVYDKDFESDDFLGRLVHLQPFLLIITQKPDFLHYYIIFWGTTKHISHPFHIYHGSICFQTIFAVDFGVKYAPDKSSWNLL